MLSRIKAFFDTELQSEEDQLSEEKIHLACAALLIEVAIVDQEFDDSEFAALQKILIEQYGVSKEECDALTQLAQQECEDATSLYQFTQLVDQHLSYNDKFGLIRGMWTIAYADGDLDKYEEYIIRKTCDLLHLAHSDFIRAKHEARADKR